AAAPAPAPEAEPAPAPGAEARWAALRRALEALDGPAARLAEGDAELRDGVLRVHVPAGRAVAEARRAAADARVAGALAREYPPGTTLEVVARVGTGSAADREAALRREVEDDPATARIARVLEARLERVVSLRETEESNDGS